jgi:hypothetical protein
LEQDVDRFYIPAERAVGREPQEVTLAAEPSGDSETEG